MAISFIGAGAVSGSSVAGTNITYAYPAGYTAVAGDLAVLIEGGWAGVSTACPNPPTGYTSHATANRQPTTGNYMVMSVYYNYLTASEAAPTRTVPTGASWASTGATWGVCGYLLIFRGTHPSTPFDISAVGSSSAAAATFTPTSITTANANAWAFSLAMTGDDNSLNLSAANSFTLRASGASYNFTSFEDLSWGAATRLITTPASVTQPTWNQSANGNDSWVAISTAIRSEVDATKVTTVFSTPVTMPAVTAGSGGEPAPAVISALTTMPAPTATGTTDATATPALISVVATLDASTETAGQTAFPAVALTPMTIDAPTQTVSGDRSPSVVSLTATLDATTETSTNNTVYGYWGLDNEIVVPVNATPTPAVISATATLPTSTKLVEETLYATSNIANNGCTNPTNANGTPDSVYTGNTGASTWDARWAIGNPSNAISGTQNGVIYWKKDATAGVDPTATLELWENGSLVSTLLSSVTLSDATFSSAFSFNATSITNKDNVELRVAATASGGSPTNRRTVQVDGFEITFSQQA